MPGNELKLQMDLPPGAGVRRSLLGWMGYPLAWADENPADIEPPARLDAPRQGNMDEALFEQALAKRVNEIVSERFSNLQDPAHPCEACGWKGGFDWEGFCPHCGARGAADTTETQDEPDDVGDEEPEEAQNQAETDPGDADEAPSEDTPPNGSRRARRAG